MIKERPRSALAFVLPVGVLVLFLRLSVRLATASPDPTRVTGQRVQASDAPPSYDGSEAENAKLFVEEPVVLEPEPAR